MGQQAGVPRGKNARLGEAQHERTVGDTPGEVGSTNSQGTSASRKPGTQNVYVERAAEGDYQPMPERQSP